MGIVATDILIKSMLEAAIADLRSNEWILEDIFSSLADDPISSPESGWKEVRSAIDWFQKTDIPVLMQHRVGDAPKIPCISIAYQPSREMEERASLADDGFEEDYLLDGNSGTAAVQKITNNFTPDKFDSSDGLFILPKGVDTSSMVVGNLIVAKSGKHYDIIQIVGSDQVKLKPDINEDFTDCYVAPKSRIWNVKREQTFISESYQIGCHTQNDPATTYWLWQIIFYSCLRYKEAFLEGRGFELSGLQSSALERNQEFQSENVFSKYVTISGQTCGSWIKYIAPKLEGVKVSVEIGDTDGAFDTTIYGEDVKNCPPTWSMVGDLDEDEDLSVDEDEC